MMVEDRIGKEGTEGLVVLGDFNAHLILLGAKDNDINGRMVLDWLDWLGNVRDYLHGEGGNNVVQ